MEPVLFSVMQRPRAQVPLVHHVQDKYEHFNPHKVLLIHNLDTVLDNLNTLIYNHDTHVNQLSSLLVHNKYEHVQAP
jgi:hypothetical protein